MAFLNSDQPCQDPVGWLRQKPPFRYVDHVTVLTPDQAAGTLLLADSGNRYVGPDRFAGMLFIEALAQLAGIHIRSRLGPGYRGYLVGIETATLSPVFDRASPISLVSEPAGEAGNILRYHGTVRQGGSVLCRALVRTYLQSGSATLDGADRPAIGEAAKSDDADEPISFRQFSGNEPYFAGHFPGDPLVPGVVLVDGMVEAGQKRIQAQGQNPLVLVGIEGARFNAPVRPGDRVNFKVRPVENRSLSQVVKCSAFLGRARCAVATLRFHMVSG